MHTQSSAPVSDSPEGCAAYKEEKISSSHDQPHQGLESFEPAKPAIDFPDGGTRAWLVVAGGWCCLFCSFGWIMCMGVFQDYYEHNELRDYGSSTIAWIPSIQVCLMFLFAPVFGKIFDNYGPFHLLVGGSLFHIFGLIMLSLCNQYYQIFLSQGICSALGTSALFYAGNNTVGRWFLRKRALALGVVSSGSSVGGLVISIMTSRLLPSIGFPWTIRVIAFIYMLVLAIAFLTVRTRLEHHPTPFVPTALIKPLTEKPVAITALASFFFFMGVFIPYDFLVLYARRKGMGQMFGLNLLAIANGTSILGRILPSWAGDKLGRFNMMFMITSLTAIFTLAIWIPASSETICAVFAVLYGFTSGSFVALIPACVAQLSPTAELGLRIGTNSLAVSVAVLLGNPIGGALISSANGEFIAVQLFAGLTMSLGAVCFGIARIAQSRSVRERV